ncbi:MAG: prepilin-type N-terminal cleavage/methylation domain-containing protein [Candidatus Absconditabacteria bacterium]
MAKSIKKLLKSFTLIELIIVIAIIAVLGATAFLLLTQWMSKGRDAQRISDLSTIKTALDIALSKNDTLPLPDETNVLLYSGTKLLYQGKFGDDVVKSIGTLNKVPKDRQRGLYEYSLLDDKKTYGVRALMENEDYSTLFASVHADDSDSVYRFIGKNMVGKIVEDKFVFLPSLFISGYINNKYDLLDGLDVFVGSRPGEMKKAGLANSSINDEIEAMLLTYGLSSHEITRIIKESNSSYNPKIENNKILVEFNTSSFTDYNNTSSFNNNLQLTTSLQGNKIQDIKTIGTVDSLSFQIGGDNYLFVTNHFSGTNYIQNSVLYKWNGSQFVNHQNIQTYGGMGITFFEKEGSSYLFIVNHRNGSNLTQNSVLYKWNGSQFVNHQNIQTIGGIFSSVKEIDNELYLFVANYWSGTTYTQNSVLYKWNGSQFVNHQNIQTTGGRQGKFIQIGEDNYLFVVQYRNSSSWIMDSILYKWNGTSFVNHQNIQTNGGIKADVRQIDGNVYLAIANQYNGSSHNINSVLYKWNGTNFVSHQNIQTTGGTDIKFFDIEGDVYLGIANNYDGSTRIVNSSLYKWNGTLFNLHQSFSTIGGANINQFKLLDKYYLYLGNLLNNSNLNYLDSYLYRFDYVSNSLSGSLVSKSESNIDLGNLGKILTLNISENKPAGTDIKYLPSFDNGISYKTFIDGNWQLTSTSQVSTQGMSSQQLKDALEGNNNLTGSKLGFYVYMSTNNNSIQPTLSNIEVEYEKK